LRPSDHRGEIRCGSRRTRLTHYLGRWTKRAAQTASSLRSASVHERHEDPASNAHARADSAFYPTRDEPRVPDRVRRRLTERSNNCDRRRTQTYDAITTRPMLCAVLSHITSASDHFIQAAVISCDQRSSGGRRWCTNAAGESPAYIMIT